VEDHGKSELHWNPSAALEQVLQGIDALSTRPEYLLLTGDLVHDGSVKSYETLAKLLNSSNIPVLITPGNHDSVENMQASLLSSRIEMTDSRSISDSNWSLLFLNTQVIHEEHGLVREEALNSLESICDSQSDRNFVLAMHHSLTPDCTTPACQLQGSERLLGLLEKYPSIKAVVSGHTHCLTESVLRGTKLLTTPSTLFYVEHTEKVKSAENDHFMSNHVFDKNRRGYRILDLYEDGHLESEVCWV